MICKICGKKFKRLGSHIKKYHNITLKIYYDKYLKKENEGICGTCLKETNFVSLNYGYYQYCSLKCSNISDSVKMKKIYTCKKHFGTKYPKQSNIVKEKCKLTCRKNFGVEFPKQSNIVKEKCKVTCRKNFGVDNPMKNAIIKQNFSKMNVQKFLPILEKLLQEKNLELLDSEYINALEVHTWKCLNCGFEFTQRWNDVQQGYRCPKCHPRNQGQSQGEIGLGDWIELLKINVIRKDKSIIGKEIDIYIPDLKIGIEYDGTYWHSKERIDYEKSNEDPKIKQLIKTELCTEKDIQLIHIFNEEWELHQENVKELLRKILLENYDMLNNDCDMITLNRRFSKNPKYYQELGYEVTIIGPKLYPNKGGFTIWDVGYFELRKECKNG